MLSYKVGKFQDETRFGSKVGVYWFERRLCEKTKKFTQTSTKLAKQFFFVNCWNSWNFQCEFSQYSHATVVNELRKFQVVTYSIHLKQNTFFYHLHKGQKLFRITFAKLSDVISLCILWKFQVASRYNSEIMLYCWRAGNCEKNKRRQVQHLMPFILHSQIFLRNSVLTYNK